MQKKKNSQNNIRGGIIGELFPERIGSNLQASQLHDVMQLSFNAPLYNICSYEYNTATTEVGVASRVEMYDGCTSLHGLLCQGSVLYEYH